ncbi:InlB B-repeat-containing protein, partial [Flavonifractor plautii]|uniref:InlB B-repeat-containing protein n=1 Tax=Flavonifractor plautii TaxID=292800 RepID=UPI0021095EE1
LYFKKLADANTKDKADYDMWQVAKGITVTLDKNGGETDAVPGFIQVELLPDVSEYQPGVPGTNPTRDGYIFKGWNTQADGTGDTYTAETKVNRSLT